jgi:hypothetical protein
VLASRDWKNLRIKKCHDMGLESSSGAQKTTKMHSKTSPMHLEGCRGDSGPKLGPEKSRFRRKPASTEPPCVHYSPPARAPRALQEIPVSAYTVQVIAPYVEPHRRTSDLQHFALKAFAKRVFRRNLSSERPA